MSPTDQSELAIEIVDHGTGTRLATDALSLDESGIEVLDQPIARPSLLSTSGEAVDRSVPVAVEKTENADKPSPVVEADSDDAKAEPPGLSRDDLVRYRQQMYRRDI